MKQKVKKVLVELAKLQTRPAPDENNKVIYQGQSYEETVLWLKEDEYNRLSSLPLVMK